VPYRLYGLALASPLDLPCPRTRGRRRRLVRLAPAGAAGFARWRPRTDRERRDWFYCRRSRSGTTYLRWTDLFEFLVSADGHQIKYRDLPRANAESLGTYLLGQVLSFSLLAFGTEPLHGTVVVVDGAAVGFLGDCGDGKSTLGAAFLHLGHPLLTDDLVVLTRTRSGYDVHPGMPRVKLFPSVAERVLGVTDGGARLNDGTTKQILALGAGQVHAEPAPLRGLYVLSAPASRRPGASIEITPLSAGAACLELVRHTFNTVVVDRDRLARQFAFASRVAARVPLKRLAYPRSLSRLPAVCEAVLADLS
jgi:hypothetical protein